MWFQYTENPPKILFPIYSSLLSHMNVSCPQSPTLTPITNLNPAPLLWSHFPSLQIYLRFICWNCLSCQQASSLLICLLSYLHATTTHSFYSQGPRARLTDPTLWGRLVVSSLTPNALPIVVMACLCLFLHNFFVVALSIDATWAHQTPFSPLFIPAISVVTSCAQVQSDSCPLLLYHVSPVISFWASLTLWPRTSVDTCLNMWTICGLREFML